MTRRVRRGRRTAPTELVIAQQPFKQPVRQSTPLDIASEDEIEAIHQASLRVLQETGISVLHSA